jgi:hypothetical protein
MSAFELLRHAGHRSEIAHVDAPRHNQMRQPTFAGTVQTLGPGTENSAAQLVGPFGGGDVEHGVD